VSLRTPFIVYGGAFSERNFALLSGAFAISREKRGLFVALELALWRWL
jgi:hypothetical protein